MDTDYVTAMDMALPGKESQTVYDLWRYDRWDQEYKLKDTDADLDALCQHNNIAKPVFVTLRKDNENE